jgi:hypothetical protein
MRPRVLRGEGHGRRFGRRGRCYDSGNMDVHAEIPGAVHERSPPGGEFPEWRGGGTNRAVAWPPVCQRRGWHQVHVVGDNAKAHRQLSTRTAPKEKSQQATFWTARRTADAIGVATWGLHPRERNRASRSLMFPGTLSGQEEELNSQTRRRGVESMDSIMATMARDITHWWEHYDTQESVGSADGTV